MKYGLLFERFFESGLPQHARPRYRFFRRCGRDRVIQYVRNKYGEKSVAQIITFGFDAGAPSSCVMWAA